jgi:ferric-dicitrate binding protein FerR (iron transport regulator)
MDDQFSPQEPGSPPFRFRQKPVPDEKTAASWQHIHSRIGKRTGTLRRRLWLAASAAVVLPLIAYASYFVYCSIVAGSMQEYRTAYGEIRRVVLPDSSTVYLNANSTLRTAAEWNTAESRGVWLDGEAYFEIAKKPGAGNARFVVHTPAIDVEVLGTKFNVNMLGPRTTVSLKEGKVQLTAKAAITEGGSVITMKPGDEVLVEKNYSRLKEAINIDLIADWRNHRYHFDNTSMSEISDLIHNKFGYKVVIVTPEIEQRTISGDLYAENISQLSRALSITMNIRIETKDEQLLFSVKE